MSIQLTLSVLDAGAPNCTALCGGEALPADLANDLVPRVRGLWNVYGPTETTIWSSLWRVEAGAPIAIGRPILKTTVRAPKCLCPGQCARTSRLLMYA